MENTNLFAAFNQLYKEIDEIYHLYAKKHNISDTALWLLYALYENHASYTQKQLCQLWHCPPQTINSILKNLEKQKYITLQPLPENQKTKLIVLTDKGGEITRKVISPLIDAEQKTFHKLTENERNALVSLTQKYVKILKKEIN